MVRCMVGGVGMMKFVKPGKQEPYFKMAGTAMRTALDEAGLSIEDVEQVYAAYNSEGSALGQRCVYELGQPGIPVFNLRNACAAGSSAIMLGRQAILSGAAECVLAVGFEEMQPGALPLPKLVPPIDHLLNRFDELGYDLNEEMIGPAMFAAAGEHYLKTYGADLDLLARIAVKSRSHAINNPYALFDQPLTVEEVLNSQMIVPPALTRLMACPPTCGAAAAVLVSDRFAREHGISTNVEIVGQAMATDTADTYANAMTLIGGGMTRRAAAKAYEQAGVGPEDLDVIELHDCFAPAELVTYAPLGLCGEGEAEQFVHDGDNTYGGKVVVNSSGGLLSKGHPVGATGLAQCFELTHQLRGTADKRQVPNARVALQHNVGLGGAAVVTIYRAAA